MKIAFKLFFVLFGLVWIGMSLNSILARKDGTAKAVINKVSILQGADGDLKSIDVSFIAGSREARQSLSLFSVNEKAQVGDTVIIDYYLAKNGEVDSIQLADSKNKYIIPVLFLLVGLISFIGGATVVRDFRNR